MNNTDSQYLALLQDVLDNGVSHNDRTGVGTRRVFGRQMRFDLKEGFPLLTTKKVHFKSVAVELLWFLRGESNIKFLKDHGVSIWDEWADADGELGPVYGVQWRRWNNEIDQIRNLIEQINNNPDSRRLIVSAWNVSDIPKMHLPPCHLMMHFCVSNGDVSCLMYQRSVDTFLGLPFNIASYSLLTHMIAHVCGLGVGDFVWTGGDVHIYNNHVEQVKTQLARQSTELPQLKISRDVRDIDNFNIDDFDLVGYNPQPAIKAPIAV
jgi:thymidylate synthase